ncbi:MAG: DUF6350 family protein [Arachnia sp.]
MSDRSPRHRSVAVDVDEPPAPAPKRLPWPWYLVAVGGALAVVAAGWLLMAGPAALGWLTSPSTLLASAMHLATSVLLLAHGVPVTISDVPVSIAPLGLSIIMVVLGQPVAALAARQAAQSEALTDDTGQLWVDGERLVWRVSGTYAAAYAVAITGVAFANGVTTEVGRALLGGAVIGAVSGLWGTSSAIGFDPRRVWPGWLRLIPRAIGIAILIVLVTGSVALVAAMVVNRERVATIHDVLAPGIAGTIILVVLQALYLPNLIIWAASWTVGAGLTLGNDSLVSLGIVDVGFLPSIPVLGALPDAGTPATGVYWWVLGGIVAGGACAAIVSVARPRSRFDITAIVGGLSGVASGLTLVVLSSLASGGLGHQRLSYAGVRMNDILIVAPSLLGLAGLVTGLIVGLIRRPRRDADAPPH